MRKKSRGAMPSRVRNACRWSDARLRGWLERHGLPVVDLLEPLLARADRAALYLPNDGHFNAAGCGAAAALLLDDVVALLRR